jgi:hypothetical protein
MIGSQRLACRANWRKVGAGWVEGDNRSGLGEVPNQDLLEPFDRRGLSRSAKDWRA